MIFKKWFSLGIAAACLSGCMLGPNYKRPELDLPTATAIDDFSVFQNYEWWTMFEDENLNRLEKQALQYNRDLQQAMARVEQARAGVTSAVADQLPTIGLQAGSGRAGNYYGSAQTVSTGTAVAAFELDLWGKYRRLSEAARGELLATMTAKDTVLLSLTAQVATAYFTLRMLDAQLEITNKTLETRRESVRIYTSRYNAGVIAEVDLRRVEADMYTVEAQAKELELQVRTAETTLAVLVGASPREIIEENIERPGHLRDAVVFPEVPQGIPSKFLANRPDVRSAEGQLIAANARIGAARAAYFPDISLTGAAGYASQQLDQLFRNQSGMWAIGGGIMQPVFSGGKIIAQNKAAKAKYAEMLAAYEKAVQTAFKEVLDALNANRLNRDTFEIRLLQTKALRRSYELTKKQEDAGLIGTMELLDVERNLLQAEMSLAQARQSELVGLVNLSKALGGGWNEQCGFGPFEQQLKEEQATAAATNASVVTNAATANGADTTTAPATPVTATEAVSSDPSAAK